MAHEPPLFVADKVSRQPIDRPPDGVGDDPVIAVDDREGSHGVRSVDVSSYRVDNGRLLGKQDEDS